MKARARHLVDMPLSLSEKAELLKIWVAPVLYLTARACWPNAGVQLQLKSVQNIALGLNSWSITRGILARPRGEGGTAAAPLHTYAQWVHSQSFVQFVTQPATFQSEPSMVFRKWA